MIPKIDENNRYEVLSEKDGTLYVMFYRKSILSGNKNHRIFKMTEDQLKELHSEDRRAIHQIVPHLSRSEREFIMTGITEEEWSHLIVEDADYE